MISASMLCSPHGHISLNIRVLVKQLTQPCFIRVREGDTAQRCEGHVSCPKT